MLNALGGDTVTDKHLESVYARNLLVLHTINTCTLKELVWTTRITHATEKLPKKSLTTRASSQAEIANLLHIVGQNKHKTCLLLSFIVEIQPVLIPSGVINSAVKYLTTYVRQGYHNHNSN